MNILVFDVPNVKYIPDANALILCISKLGQNLAAIYNQQIAECRLMQTKLSHPENGLFLLT